MFEIGDVVEERYGCEGQIIAQYPNFWVIEQVDSGHFCAVTAEEWLDMQVISFTKRQVEREKWYMIALFDGGTCIAPQSTMKLIERIDLRKLFKVA